MHSFANEKPGEGFCVVFFLCWTRFSNLIISTFHTLCCYSDASSRVFPVDSKTELGTTLIGFDERMLLHAEVN